MDLAQYEAYTWRFFSRHHPDGYRHAPCPLRCEGGSTLQFTKNGILSIVKCDCGIVRSDPQPNQHTLDQFYSNSMAMSIWSDLKKHDILKQKKKYSQAINYMVSRNVLSVLDVGCGNGVFLSLYGEAMKDAKLFGCELSPQARKVASFGGINTIEALSMDGYFEKHPQAFFNAITLWGVLEHVKDPMLSLAMARDQLTSGGVVVICVPNVESLVAQTLKEQCFTYCPQHLWYFSIATLGKLMDDCGLFPVRTYTIESEVLPILRSREGLSPYDNRVYPMSVSHADKISEEILRNQEGYKIVMIAERR